MMKKKTINGGKNKRLESKKGSHKNEAEVKKYRGNIRKVHKKKNFRGYGDVGNKLRRRKSREVRPRTKEIKKKRDKDTISKKRKMRSRNKRWTKKEKKKKKKEKRREKKNGETKGRKKKKR